MFRARKKRLIICKLSYTKNSGGVVIASVSYNATTYDWNLYHESVMAIAPVKRERLEQIALKASLDTSGEER